METILLIESDPATLIARALILRCFGYEVLEASSRGEAWCVCNEHQGPIHLILTEAGLDAGNFSEFITRLQLPFPQICVLFIADASAELADMPCEYAFLQRQFRANALAHSIRGLLDGPKTRAVPSLA
jgi:CheY-like chemotaxis protein